jgi:hypothetical protein
MSYVCRQTAWRDRAGSAELSDKGIHASTDASNPCARLQVGNHSLTAAKEFVLGRPGGPADGAVPRARRILTDLP